MAPQHAAAVPAGPPAGSPRGGNAPLSAATGQCVTALWRRRVVVLGVAMVVMAATAWVLFPSHLLAQASIEYAGPRTAGACALPPKPVAAPAATAARPLRVAVVTLFDDRHADSRFRSSLAVAEGAIANKAAYCRRHGYDLIVARGDAVDPSRPAAWSKLKAVAAALPRYDWVAYVDLDAVVMNMSVTVQDLLAYAAPGHDLLLATDRSDVNDGVFLMRNSSWSRWLLEEMWAQSQLVRCPRCLFQYEQRALHYLLHTRVWVDAGLPVWPGDPATLWPHILILPQCALNAYALHPLYALYGRGGSRQYRASQYRHGDFILHMAGYTGDDKAQLIRWAVRWAAAHNRNMSATAPLSVTGKGAS